MGLRIRDCGAEEMHAMGADRRPAQLRHRWEAE